MKNVKQIKIVALALITLTALIGCGGGGGGGSNSSAAETVVVCNDTNTSWTTLQSADVVTATANTQLKFEHDSDGKKQVCVVETTPAGSATIN